MALSRKTPLRSRKPWKKKPPKKNPQTVKRKRERRASEFARAYHSRHRVLWVAARPCLACEAVPSENCHTESGGTGRKADFNTIVPLCRKHHRELHRGAQTFERKYNLDLPAAAAATDSAYQAHLAAA